LPSPIRSNSRMIFERRDTPPPASESCSRACHGSGANVGTQTCQRHIKGKPVGFGNLKRVAMETGLHLSDNRRREKLRLRLAQKPAATPLAEIVRAQVSFRVEILPGTSPAAKSLAGFASATSHRASRSPHSNCSRLQGDPPSEPLSSPATVL